MICIPGIAVRRTFWVGGSRQAAARPLPVFSRGETGSFAGAAFFGWRRLPHRGALGCARERTQWVGGAVARSYDGSISAENV